MDLRTFIAKWTRSDLAERAASQEHFLDLCKLLGVKTPAELDPTGEVFTFEKPVRVTGAASAGSQGQRGFADVWYKDRFGWEYKRKGKYGTLADAYRQLNQYRDDLGNPPLLIVSDIARTQIHTNFTGFKSEMFEVDLASLAEPGQLDLLRRAFLDPASFKPDETPEQVTEKAAKAIGEIAQGLRSRGHDPHDAAHFLMKVMFCLFAEDVELLPKGLFERMLGKYRHEPARLKSQMDALFGAMRTGGDFGIDEIAYFNGGLFDDASALELTEPEIASLVRAASKSWNAVEPSIFGTLFERSLDPDKRAQIGAHYTSRDDIMLVIEPVIVRPLRREWEDTQAKIADQLERRRKAKTPATKNKADAEIADLYDGFQQRLASVRVLDPACGSGNFLYVAIQQLLDLELEVIVSAARPEIGRGGLIPKVRPTQLLGIEINPYAAELAQVVIWIGYLQWMRDNGFNAPRNPILEPITTIENRDAILAWEDEQGQPIPVWREGAKCRGQAKWPEADFVVGNPPFLGVRQFRQSGLHDDVVKALHRNSSLPSTVDLVCYWFERAAADSGTRVGLLATQAIRGVDNRAALAGLADDSGIFGAWSNRAWVLDGAAVRVAMIFFGKALPDEPVLLDGLPVGKIFANLTAGLDLTTAKPIDGLDQIDFQGPVKVGAFDIEWQQANELLAAPRGPGGNANFDVLKQWFNGSGITKRNPGKWIIDFADMSLHEAALYDEPMAYVRREIKPGRDTNSDRGRRECWWKLGRVGTDMRERLSSTARFLATPRVSKHRLFEWRSSRSIPDARVVGIAVTGDYHFGVLHSSVHECWSIALGPRHGVGNDFTYNHTTCFETFPLPWPPGKEPADGSPLRPLHDAIAAAAEALNDQRERWLNPPEWIEEVAAEVDATDDFADVARVSGEEARRLIRQSAIDALAAKHPKLKKRTLTNLYNERPTWLRLAHKALDEAVLAAYAAVDPEGGWKPSWAEVFEEKGAGQPLPEQPGPDGEPQPHPLAERRAEVEQAILGALLRLNGERAKS